MICLVVHDECDEDEIHFLELDDEIETLKKRQKKRQMIQERRAKRSHRVKARNLSDRIELENDDNPHWR